MEVHNSLPDIFADLFCDANGFTQGEIEALPWTPFKVCPNLTYYELTQSVGSLLSLEMII